MPEGIFLGFDFGFKRIGVAVGQRLTQSASPLVILAAKEGVPHWTEVQALLNKWRPIALIVGYPSCIDGSELYTSEAAKNFAEALRVQFKLPVYLVDERLSTVEARSYLFERGGYRNIKKSDVDSVAACIILEQWLRDNN